MIIRIRGECFSNHGSGSNCGREVIEHEQEDCRTLCFQHFLARLQWTLVYPYPVVNPKF